MRGDRIGEVDGWMRHERVRAHETREPVAGARARIGRQPTIERGRDGIADGDEDVVAGDEREVTEHRFGFVGEEELQRVVVAHLARTGHDDGDDGVGERGLGPTRFDERGGDAIELGDDGRAQDRGPPSK